MFFLLLQQFFSILSVEYKLSLISKLRHPLIILVKEPV